MPVYTLYLSTQITSPATNIIVPVNKTNLANVSWNIDWDNLFRKENYLYTNCRVRFQLVTNKWSASAGNTDWDDYQGYLGCSLPSSYNATTTNNTILGMIFPTDVYTITASTSHAYVISSLSDVGVDINMPKYNSIFNLQFRNTNTQSFISSTIMPEYQILLTFELYNQDD